MALDTQQEINKNFSFACVCQKKSNPENPEIAQVETSESRGRESQLLLVQFPNPHLTSESHFVNLTCGFYAPAGLQRSSEGQPAHFTVVCRDSAGDQLTRGGEHVVVSVAHREKKDWWVWLVKKGKKKRLNFRGTEEVFHFLPASCWEQVATGFTRGHLLHRRGGAADLCGILSEQTKVVLDNKEKH